MKNLSRFWNMFPVLLIIFGALLLISRFLIKRMKEQRTAGPEATDDETTEAEIIEDDEPEPTKEARIINHFQLIRKVLPTEYSDDVARMITAQAMHETGIFTSRLYREQNNLFGMRQPVLRDTLSTGERNGYATFASQEDSVKDLMLYFKEFKMPAKYASINDYVKRLSKNGYFTANYLSYFNPVRTYYNQLKELIQ